MPALRSEAPRAPVALEGRSEAHRQRRRFLDLASAPPSGREPPTRIFRYPEIPTSNPDIKSRHQIPTSEACTRRGGISSTGCRRRLYRRRVLSAAAGAQPDAAPPIWDLIRCQTRLEDGMTGFGPPNARTVIAPTRGGTRWS